MGRLVTGRYGMGHYVMGTFHFGTFCLVIGLHGKYLNSEESPADRQR